MEFRTALKIKPSEEKIHPTAHITSLGSCFADNIGSKFSEMKIDILSNPFGVIYNPISLMKLINHSLFNDELNDNHIVENVDIYNHLDAHSRFGKTSLQDLRNDLENAKERLKSHLQNSNILILTFGTAYVYRYDQTNEIIANCHKLPAANFSRELLEIDQIVDSSLETLRQVREINPKLKIIFTVSPVRHTRDGLTNNSLSKSILRYAVDKITNQLENTSYFPAYEIMIDDLRDYRFYAEDLIHPNDMAQNYVWMMFKDTYFSEPLMTYCDKWQSIKNDLQHRVMNPGSKEHVKFLENLIQKLEKFSVVADVSTELEDIKGQLEDAKS